MVGECLMYLLGVQMTVTDQLARKQQHRNLVAIAHLCPRIGIDFDDVHGKSSRRRQGSKFGEHFFAKPAPGTGVQHKARRGAATVSGGAIHCRQRM